MHLNTQQVNFIEADIKKRGLTNKTLRREILDHVCCAIEVEMAKGILFHKAYVQVIKQFGEDGFLQLQAADKQALRKQRMIKKAGRILTSTAACLLIFITTIGQAKDIPSIHPLKDIVPITSAFGMRVHPSMKKRKMHLGVDFKIPTGTKVYATADGIITKVETAESGYGKRVIIQHDDGYSTLYAHLSAFEVTEGQKVKKGELIAYSGNSGMSTHPHLHYEVRQNGRRVNPKDYMTIK